jgi:hypothetical protein
MVNSILFPALFPLWVILFLSTCQFNLITSAPARSELPRRVNPRLPKRVNRKLVKLEMFYQKSGISLLRFQFLLMTWERKLAQSILPIKGRTAGICRHLSLRIKAPPIMFFSWTRATLHLLHLLRASSSFLFITSRWPSHIQHLPTTPSSSTASKRLALK